MATTYNLAITRNPNFNTVLGLTNTVFDRNNVRSGQMATEDQIQQLWQDIIRLEERIDYCCRDIVFWDVRVRIRDKYGNIMSDYLENRRTGIMRRGKNYTMEIPLEPIPKYEAQVIGSTTTSWPNTDFEDDNKLSCVKNGAQGNSSQYQSRGINDLCGILYRGTSGQYYDMSVRKTSAYLGFPAFAFTIHCVDENGQEGTLNLAFNAHSTNAARILRPNTHFAYVENGKLYVDVKVPIGDEESFLPQTRVKPYGRIYYLDVRDVTLGD